MKHNLILSMVLGLFMVGGLNAQDGQPPQQNMQQRRQQQIDALKKELVLTKDQDTKFDAIYKETAEKVTAARTAASDDREAMRTKMTEINKDRDLKIEKILTKEQVGKFKAYQEKQAAERANRQRGGGGGGGR
jgi:Spy/CpxP family protein refolding chaperone